MVRVEPARLDQLEALLDGDDVFTSRFGVAVEPGWAGFPAIVPHSVSVARDGAPPEWGTHLFFDEADGALIGVGGWKGPPIDGAAEIGYAVAPSRQGRGVARTAVERFVDQGRATGLRTVYAHTLAEESPSTSVLRRCGFERAGDPLDQGSMRVWRWELDLTR